MSIDCEVALLVVVNNSQVLAIVFFSKGFQDESTECFIWARGLLANYVG